VGAVAEDSAARIPMWLAVAGAILVGVLTATQARINGSLGATLHDGIAAAFVSFGSGLVLVLAVCLATRGGRAGLARLRDGLRERAVPGWMLFGGLAGAFSVATQGLTVATIGVALFTIGVVAGQTAGGVVLDRVGFGPGGVVSLTPGRVVGALLAIAAVAVGLAGEGALAAPWWMLVLPILAGAGISWQQATNGRLRARVGSPLVATTVNFAGGTLALAIAAGAHVVVAGAPAPFPSDPWLYLGGAAGVVYIFLSAALVRITGVLILGLGSVVGLLATSVVLDAVWPPVAGPPLGVALAAVAVAVVGVGIAVLRRRR
jgi:bacterial/archaeal transporter family-2 protein